VARKQKLEALLRRHEHRYVRYSEPFKNGEQLLAECRTRRLEGIISKRKHAPYKSGKCDWIKVKCAQWKEENKDRGELFMRPR
jgi:bifunctional non-homologous end joining protein LigD